MAGVAQSSGVAMRVIECPQYSNIWWSARLGKPTASGMSNIITRTGKKCGGASYRRYMLQLLGERITNQPAQMFETEAMRRGTDLEPSARAWYELTTGHAVKQIGFILSDCERHGCSPDGIVTDHGLEIKCPMLHTFLDVATSGVVPDEHWTQMQHSMLITGFDFWDYVLYTDAPGCLPQVIKVEQDPRFHDALRGVLDGFCDELNALHAEMVARGHGIKHVEEEPIAGDPFA